MRVDLNIYIRSKEVAQNWYLTHGKDDPKTAVSTLAFMTGCPCIVVTYWIGEVEGYPDWILTKIDSLMKFYGYTEILNKPEGVPK